MLVHLKKIFYHYGMKTIFAILFIYITSLIAVTSWLTNKSLVTKLTDEITRIDLENYLLRRENGHLSKTCFREMKETVPFRTVR